MSRFLIHIDATAGWGKTTAIEKDIKKYAELVSDWKGGSALYLVFTRRNAYSARRRLSGYVRAENIRTLHSFCYSFLPRKPVMDGEVLERFSREYGYRGFSSGAFFTPRSREDSLLSFYYWARNRCLDLEEAVSVKEEQLRACGLTPSEVLLFCVRWEAFKKREGALDYADILEHSNPRFEGVYLALDEAQDCTPLMWKAFEKILASSPSLKRVVVVGDCDQTVYEFQGSDPQMFLLFPETLARRHGFTYKKFSVKHISKRVPSKPLSFALRFLTKVRVRDHSKNILPAREGGEVLFMTREEFLDLVRREKRKVVIQERHRHELEWWRQRLELMGIPYVLTEEDLEIYRRWKGLMEKSPKAYAYFYKLFSHLLPSWEMFLKEKDRYLSDFYSNPERFIPLLPPKARSIALHHPKNPVFLTTMHSQKGEEGDVVWVSGKWTKRVKVSDEERKLYFTACTRTRDVLVIDRSNLPNILSLLS